MLDNSTALTRLPRHLVPKGKEPFELAPREGATEEPTERPERKLVLDLVSQGALERSDRRHDGL